MRYSWLHIVTGLLVGIVVTQWATPGAPSAQPSPEMDTLTVRRLVVTGGVRLDGAPVTLVNDDGVIVGMLAPDYGGGSPFLVLESPNRGGEPSISLWVKEDGATVGVSNGGTGLLQLAAFRDSVGVAGHHGQRVFLAIDNLRALDRLVDSVE